MRQQQHVYSCMTELQDSLGGLHYDFHVLSLFAPQPWRWHLWELSICGGAAVRQCGLRDPAAQRKLALANGHVRRGCFCSVGGCGPHHQGAACGQVYQPKEGVRPG